MPPEETYSPQAVIYIRIAREAGSAAAAVAAQRHACERRANELGLSVVREYVDYGSGLAIENRPELKALLNDLTRQSMGYVVAYGHAQIARDMQLYAKVSWAIHQAGARLEIASLPHMEPGSFTMQLIGKIGAFQFEELWPADVTTAQPKPNEREA